MENSSSCRPKPAYIKKMVNVGTYRSDYRSPGATDLQKAQVIQSLLDKMGFTPKLCRGPCPNNNEKCKPLNLKSDPGNDDCELSVEMEIDGTKYYKAKVTQRQGAALAQGEVKFFTDSCKCLVWS